MKTISLLRTAAAVADSVAYLAANHNHKPYLHTFFDTTAVGAARRAAVARGGWLAELADAEVYVMA